MQVRLGGATPSVQDCFACFGLADGEGILVAPKQVHAGSNLALLASGLCEVAAALHTLGLPIRTSLACGLPALCEVKQPQSAYLALGSTLDLLRDMNAAAATGTITASEEFLALTKGVEWRVAQEDLAAESAADDKKAQQQSSVRLTVWSTTGQLLGWPTSSARGHFWQFLNQGMVRLDILFILIAFFTQIIWLRRWDFTNSYTCTAVMLVLMSCNVVTLSTASFARQTYIKYRIPLCLASHLLHKVAQSIITLIPVHGTVYSPSYGKVIALLESSCVAQCWMLGYGLRLPKQIHLPMNALLVAIGFLADSAICRNAFGGSPVCVMLLPVWQVLAGFIGPCLVIFRSEAQIERAYKSHINDDVGKPMSHSPPVDVSTGLKASPHPVILAPRQRASLELLVKHEQDREPLRSRSLLSSLPENSTYNCRPSITAEAQRLVETFANSWQVDMRELDMLTDGRALSTLGMHCIKQAGMIKRFSLSESRLAFFLQRVEAGYDEDNPYHNRLHAANVLHTMHMLVQHGGLRSSGLLPDLSVLACYIAAIIHDFEHPGLGNDFLVRTQHPLATTYNDRSPLENHHVAAAFRILQQPDYNFMKAMTAEDRTAVRLNIVDQVLGSDLKSHFSLLARFQAAYCQDTEDSSSLIKQLSFKAGTQRTWSIVALTEEQKRLACQVALKVADLGHLACARVVHQRWVGLLQEEFCRQGDVERQLGLSVSPQMDRSGSGIANSQVAFFEFIALPLFTAFTRAFDESRPLLEAINDNYQSYLTAIESEKATTSSSP